MRKWISRILFVVSIILLSISLYFLMGLYLEDRKSETGFDNIRQIGTLGTGFFLSHLSKTEPALNAQNVQNRTGTECIIFSICLEYNIPLLF